jgi:hypothetical protein
MTPEELEKLYTSFRRPSPFYKTLLKAADLHSRKNANYAKESDPFSNFRLCEQFGVPAWKGVLVRMSDKWSRIMNLANGVPDLVEESLKDSIMDLGVYAFILVSILEEKKEEEE